MWKILLLIFAALAMLYVFWGTYHWDTSKNRISVIKAALIIGVCLAAFNNLHVATAIFVGIYILIIYFSECHHK